MKIIRWFFSHILLIMMVIVVIYSYMYWGNLLGKDTPAGKALAYLSNEFEFVDDFVKETQAKRSGAVTGTEHAASSEPGSQSVAASDQPTARDSRLQSGPESAPNDLTAAGEVDQTARVEVQPEATQTEQPKAETSTGASQAEPEQQASAQTATEQPVSVSYQSNQRPVTQDSAGHTSAAQVAPQAGPHAASEEGSRNVSVADAKQVPATPNDSASPHYVTPEIEQQLNNVDDRGHVIDPSVPGEAVRQSWVEARKSFYRRDYEKSEQNYRTVIDNTEDNFDAYGELGNVYYVQGKKKQAADAYFQAASILIKHGQIRRASSLMGLLRRLDPEKAKELYNLLEQSKP